MAEHAAPAIPAAKMSPASPPERRRLTGAWCQAPDPGCGVLGGTAVGALHDKNLGLSDGDKARLTVELTAGKAAVGVLAQSDTAPAISDRLTQLGGAPEAHELTDEALQTAATGAPA
jgi:hypothetical protein